MTLPLIDGALFLDATAFEKYTTCRRSFQYYFLHKRESVGQRPALEAGAIFHEAMLVRRKLEHKMSLELYELAQEGAIHRCYQGWTPPLDDFRTESHLIDVIRAYNRSPIMQNTFTPLIGLDGEPMAEVPFAEYLMTVTTANDWDIPVYWCGRLDYPTLWGDELWNLDYKTTTMDNGFDEYLNNHAQIGYLWALWKKTNKLPAGFVIDLVLWRKPSAKGKGIEFKRHRERIERTRIEEWFNTTCMIVEDIIRDSKANRLPMETAWCKGKWGFCPYLDICKLPPDNRQLLLESAFYKDVTWNPLRQP